MKESPVKNFAYNSVTNVKDVLLMQSKYHVARELIGTNSRKKIKNAWVASPPKLLPMATLPGMYLESSQYSADNSAEPSFGLVSLVDSIASKALPWQASRCPRALELLRDIRMDLCFKEHHGPLIARMASQLQNNVVDFLIKKEIEVEKWLAEESTAWQSYIDTERKSMTAFIYDSNERKLQNKLLREEGLAYRQHQFLHSQILTELNDRKQKLDNYRRVCQSWSEYEADEAGLADKRALYSSFALAQNKIDLQKQAALRDKTRYL